MLDSCSGESQCYVTLPSIVRRVRRHRSRPASDYASDRIFKFADDTYLVVPAANSSSRLDEVSHVEAWASRNNLSLNRTKSKELISIREKSGQSSQPPPPCPNIERVSCAMVLGITLNDRLSATDHVNNLLTTCSSAYVV